MLHRATYQKEEEMGTASTLSHARRGTKGAMTKWLRPRGSNNLAQLTLIATRTSSKGSSRRHHQSNGWKRWPGHSRCFRSTSRSSEAHRTTLSLKQWGREWQKSWYSRTPRVPLPRRLVQPSENALERACKKPCVLRRHHRQRRGALGAARARSSPNQKRIVASQGISGAS